MEGTRTIPTPNKLATIPQIVLDTTDKDKICLLTAGQGKMDLAMSLPNLSDPENYSGGSCRAAARKANAEKARRDSGAHLNVYCSPRVSRKPIVPAPCDLPQERGDNNKPTSPLRAIPKSRFNFYKNWGGFRTDSNSSNDSDSSIRSASHISTCASSDFYNKFSSCDRLSMHADGTSANPFGTLRRIYSNPEPPLCKLAIEESNSPPRLRDAKSCTNLEGTGTTVNHNEVEYKLTQENGNLLSPPNAVPTTTQNHVLDHVGGDHVPDQQPSPKPSKSKSKGKPIDRRMYKADIAVSQEDLLGKNNRIKRWLAEIPTPSGTVNVQF
jgi:hypothetical protein